MNLYFAPLQGYTDAAYRRIHNEIFDGCIDSYYTPFVRLERRLPRAKDLRDISLKVNNGVPVVPQIIAKDIEEFKILVDAITNIGYTNIDINLGCPFPLQVKRGRGAALLSNKPQLETILKEVTKLKGITFSVKMRLGNTNHYEWCECANILNDAPLSHITLHPRIATQQYKGTVDIDIFKEFMSQINHPIVYNGDITTTGHINQIANLFPNLKGIMIGRGLLAAPSLAWEWRNNITLTITQQLNKLLRLHDMLMTHYQTTLQGESHLLTKMRTFWDFSEPLIGHKTLKLINKASTMSKYHQAIEILSK